MNDETQCSLEDLNQAAEELIALGCAAGAMHIHDGVARLGFLGEVSAFVDEVIEDVKEGVISAAEGVAVFWEEQRELRDKVIFYGSNGVTLAGGLVQVKAGVALVGATSGLAAPLGAGFILHGANNIYESSSNIYNGQASPSSVGPVRAAYQRLGGNQYSGNMIYSVFDLSLSASGLMYLVRKPGKFQLFRVDRINYERSYKQMGRVALGLEVAVDAVTVQSIAQEQNKNSNLAP